MSARISRGKTGIAGTAHELARSVRKPQAPPVRVQKSGKEYDRRTMRRAIEEQTEESK